MKKFVSLLLAVALCCVAVFGAVAETVAAPRTYNFVFIVKSMW